MLGSISTQPKFLQVSAEIELVWTDFYLVSTEIELVRTVFQRGAGIFAERLHTILNRNANHSHQYSKGKRESFSSKAE